MKRISKTIILISILSILFPASVAMGLDRKYELTDLGFLFVEFDEPTPLFSMAHGINESAEVTGRSGGWPVLGNPFLWENGSTWPVAAPASLPGVISGWGSDINDSGVIAGVIQQSFQGPAVNTEHGFIYSQGASTLLQDFLPTRINNQGQVLGSFSGGQNLGASALWHQGNQTILPLSTVTDLNADGHVVGNAIFSSGVQGARWVSGALDELDPLSGHTTTDARVINDAGNIFGWSMDGGGSKHLVKWSGSDVVDLADFSSMDFNIHALNNLEQAVGGGVGVSGSYASLWEAGEFIDLNQYLPAGSSWQLAMAEDINEYGQIVGYGYADGLPFQRAYLLSPVVTPEPLSAALFSLGAGVLLLRRRRPNK